jgi:hypothetical protein
MNAPSGNDINSSDFTTGWSDLIYASAVFESYRCIGVGTFKSLLSRLVMGCCFRQPVCLYSHDTLEYLLAPRIHNHRLEEVDPTELSRPVPEDLENVAVSTKFNCILAHKNESMS